MCDRAGEGDIGVYAEKICVECCNSEKFHQVIRTISYRLNDISTKQASIALQLLHILLLSGPEGVLTEALNLIPQLRMMLDPTSYKSSSSIELFANNTASQAHAILQPKAQAVLSLLFDQGKLFKQRRWSNLWRHGGFILHTDIVTLI